MSERRHDPPDDPSDGSSDIPADGSTTTGDEFVAPEEPSPSLEDLTLPERVLLAAIQDPVRGFVVVALLLFAVSFLIALAFVYPLVAAGFFLFSAIVLLAFVGYGVRQLRARETERSD